MKKSLKYREAIADARRVVVKIGTRVLTLKTGRPDVRRMRELTRQLALLHKAGHEVVLITSGAVGAGIEALGMRERPTALPDLQMAAAVGQARLMSRYGELFAKRDVTVGQVLLTHADFNDKIRLTNIRRTLTNLLRYRVIPIVNENDVVADEEIKADLSFGDNDLLASLVVKLIRADLLIILTTVDGLREPDGAGAKTRRVRYIESITRGTHALVKEGASALSKGGMSSKLRAADAAARAGCSSVIANGRGDDVLCRVMRGEDVGTFVLASGL